MLEQNSPEIIISIEKIEEEEDSGGERKDGYKVTTNKQTIFMGITNYTECCEEWGYFMSEDDISYYIGAELKEINIVDTQLKVGKHTKKYKGNVMFVNLETSMGTLQFTAYNEHNGYYGHQAVVESEQLKHEVKL